MNREICVLVIIISISLDLVSSKPAEESKKFTLDTPEEILDNNIIKSSSNSTHTRWDRAMERLGQIMDALRIGRGRLVNLAMMTRNVIAERVEEFVSEASNKVVAVIAAKEAREYAHKATKATKRSTGTTTATPVHIGPLDSFLPPKIRENVRLESEAGQSLFEIKHSKPVEGALEGILMPKPIIDRITESEKYGNAGDKFIGVGRVLVNGFEGLSNFLNSIIDLPVQAAKKTSRGLTAALNQVGGKLIGLE